MNGINVRFEEPNEWIYQDSTGNRYMLNWCYTESANTDENFMIIFFPRIDEGTYTWNGGPNGSPDGDSYNIIYKNNLGQRCVLTSGTYTVDELDESQSVIKPYKAFNGRFSAILINEVTSEVLTITDGKFNQSDF